MLLYLQPVSKTVVCRCLVITSVEGGDCGPALTETVTVTPPDGADAPSLCVHPAPAVVSVVLAQEWS